MFRLSVLVTALMMGSAYSLPTSPAVELAKRAEGVHLTNCVRESGSDILSAVIYCANDTVCHPTDNDFCTVETGSFFRWEGAPQQCTFLSGTTFSWDLPADAQSRPTYSEVDHSASNGFRGWTGHLDDQSRVIVALGWRCTSIYYYL